MSLLWFDPIVLFNPILSLCYLIPYDGPYVHLPWHMCKESHLYVTGSHDALGSLLRVSVRFNRDSLCNYPTDAHTHIHKHITRMCPHTRTYEHMTSVMEELWAQDFEIWSKLANMITNLSEFEFGSPVAM